MECKLEGVYSAIFSVYDENLRVKKNTVQQMVNYQLENGLKGFYVCGNTGECTILPETTRKEMLEAVVEANNGRGEIIAHIGAGHFDETVRLVDHANTQEIDAIASLPPSLTPYYNINETLAYYAELAKRSKHPVIAYITPVLRGNPVEFAEKLLQIPNIGGIKLTIGDYYSFGAITALKEGKVNVLNGPDETLICGLSVGAQGAIGTTYNFVPDWAKRIYDSFKKGDLQEALKMQRKLNKIINLGLGKPISYWKEMLALRGFDMGYTIFPGGSVSKAESEELKVKLQALEFFV